MRIELDRITKCFGATVAVDAVTIRIHPGELFFLLGPSGCGKTTLLRVIAGFHAPDAGKLLFNGETVTHRPAYRRNTGMVFQNYALWPHMTVAENVAFGLTVPGRRPPAAERRRRVHEVLQQVRMQDYAQRRPGQLSGGQQQRVALARALIIRPACLLFDEPLSNLDAQLRLELRSEIKRIVAASGLTSIYVTHDQKEALSMADRCAVMRNGRIEQIAAPRELYERPANAFVAGFIGETNLIPGRLIERQADGNCIIEAAGRAWRGLCPHPSAMGADVLLSIRPESILTDATAAPGVNGFEARLLDTVYLGEHTEYRLQLDHGFLLKAFCRSAPAPVDGAGSRYRFSVAVENVLVIPPGTESG